MQYLVQMKLASHPSTAEASHVLAEQSIVPTLELLKKLQEQKRIVAGGPMSGTIAIALVVDVESVQQLDDMLASLPAWPRMETRVTPLNTLDGRITALRRRAES